MVFSSTIFLFIFLPVTLAMYYICDKRLKNIWLFIVSLFFYSWGEPKYLLLMLASISLNYILALLINHFLDKGRIGITKSLLALTIVSNIACLIYFKYLDFIITNVNQILGANFTLKNIALPVGISFFTFQAMSYVIDVYRRDAEVQKNILNLGLYISLFPQLIAGPIVRYIDIEKQLENRSIDATKIYDGVKLFIIGFCKKILIADQLASLCDSIFAVNGISAPSAWIGAISYSLQIFFDFSGYSDMAVGLGKLFGFEFVNNFNYPYISKTIKEFWRRWHISLSTWFRDYVYIPLGGSRCKPLRAYLNLTIVFFLTGFWHGASWNFIVWGLYYAVFLVLERLFLGKLLEKIPKILQHVYALFVIIIGWVFFRAENLTSALIYIKNMFTVNSSSINDLIPLMNKRYILCILCGIIFSIPWTSKIKVKHPVIVDIILIILFIIAIAYMIGSGFSPFLYFRF